jgi:hypothetical protein
MHGEDDVYKMRRLWWLNSTLGTVRVFRQKFTLEDAIGSHACSLQANMRVAMGMNYVREGASQRHAGYKAT